MQNQKKMKHNYTSELELKSLLIRIKNTKQDKGDKRLNRRINKYIKLHTHIKSVKYKRPKDTKKRNRIKNLLKERIIRDSVLTCIDDSSYERFGVVILLMIKNILTKPNFSGYTYVDDFYSDAVYKILKYLHNFDHTMISQRTGQPVNSFAYISQYIHNSIIYIINTKKKENDNMKKRVEMENLTHNLQLRTIEIMKSPSYTMPPEEKIKDIFIDEINTSLLDVIGGLKDVIKEYDRVNVYYPKNYLLEYDEITKLSPFMDGKVSIIRSED